MKRIKLIVAYDGTDYSGWQIQPNKETIEGVLNRELSRLLNEEIKVIGASRTDSGVHAEGAVCVFDTESRIPGEKVSYALNQSLPNDIVIRKSEEVAPDFHPRKVPCRKTYRYSIWHDEFMKPTNQRYTHWVYTKLDLEAMNEACKYFEGKHDFKSLCSVHTDVENTERTIYDVHIEITPERSVLQASGLVKTSIKDGGVTNSQTKNYKPRGPQQIDIYVTGNGFLYNMVRIIAGTLIDVGQGRIKAEDIPDIIDGKNRQLAGQTAPAKGLTLVGYLYKK